MRTNISYFFGLMSLLYLFIAIGLVLFLINLMQTMPKPLNRDFFVQAGETDALSARNEGDQVPSPWRQLVPPDVLVNYAMLGTLDSEKRDAAQREAHASVYTQRVTFELNADAPLTQQAQQVLSAVAAGDIDPETGKVLIDAISAFAGLKATDDLENRLAALEGRQA